MNRKGVEHNRLLLTYNMMRGGMNVIEAWKEAGKKIARSKVQLNSVKRRIKTAPVTIWED